ncbi:cellobiose phosphorylase [Candidatus Kryptonium thompsonii]|nr:cellobiose phosphorylase [Candidatus Kryptonium thompsoni]
MQTTLNIETKEIIHEGKPPSDWSIILTNGKYSALILYNGTGQSFHEHPTFNSIIKWIPKVNSQLGRFVYVKDIETDENWCLNLPSNYKFNLWKVHFGIGYLKIETMKEQILGEITYFVPIDKDLEYWIIKIKNKSGRKKHFKIFSAVELSLGNLHPSILDPYAYELFVRTWVKDKTLYATKTFWIDKIKERANKSWDKIVFFASDPPPESFDSLKSAFIGDGTIELPQAVKEGWCFESIANGREAIFAFQHDVEIENEEEKEILISLGILNERTKPDAEIEIAKNDFAKTSSYITHELIEKGIKVQTPDDVVNIFVNNWNKYQNWICFNLHRYPASNYVAGFDLVGYRDALQSILGILPINHRICKERLIYLFKFQFKNGNTCHSFNPIDNYAEISNQSDDPLWLCITMFEYLKETGDLEILKHEVNYYDSDEKNSIYLHLKKAIDFVLGLRGKHGLVLLRGGDWNDALNFAGIQNIGESTLASMILLYTLNEWIKLNEFLKIDVEDYKAERDKLKDSINEHCYEEYKKLDNAGWFIRAITDDGEKIGSYFSKEGKIYLEPQVWAVISDACDKERKINCLKSVIKFLESTYGFLLLDPAYTKVDEKLGIITRFLAGEKENGSFFIHANSWAIIALSMLKDEFKEKAFEIYSKLIPLRFMNDKRYKAEPFVYPQYICGKDSPHFGEASFTWLTSSSAWMFKAFYEYICGIRPDYEGIRIERPVFPANWNEVTVDRVFRNCIYKFKFKQTGEFSIEFEGRKLSTQTLPSCGCGGAHEVEIFF